MLEVRGRLIRECGVYAHGEIVECVIDFIHLQTVEKDEEGNEKPQEDESGERVEGLAWASVQLHCYRKTSYTMTTNNPKDKVADITEKLGKTALDGTAQAINATVLIETKPKILFCDLNLKPGESKKYMFEEVIPRDGPPTFKGQDVRYFYKITIAAQRLMSKVQYLTIPIRVLPIPVVPSPEDIPCTEETNAELTPTNPFLEKHEPTELEFSWHRLNNLNARRSPKHYRISNRHGFVTRFCLYKPTYKLGEYIVGSLDFEGCQVRCVQYSVKLQCQEIDLHLSKDLEQGGEVDDDASSVHSMDKASVASGSVAGNLHKSSTSGSVKKAEASEEPVGKVSSHAYHHEVSYAMVKTFISIPIPLHVTPSFRSDLVDVRWRLHFEFVTSTMMNFGTPCPEEGEYQAPEQINVESMSWDLPITLYATNPLQISSLKQKFSLIIK